MSTNLDCLELKVGHIWYDTVDQPVIPIEVKNNCEKTVVVSIHVKSSDGRLLHKSSPFKLKSQEKKAYEVVVSYYGDADVTGEWTTEDAINWRPIKAVRVKL